MSSQTRGVSARIFFPSFHVCSVLFLPQKSAKLDWYASSQEESCMPYLSDRPTVCKLLAPQDWGFFCVEGMVGITLLSNLHVLVCICNRFLLGMAPSNSWCNVGGFVLFYRINNSQVYRILTVILHRENHSVVHGYVLYKTVHTHAHTWNTHRCERQHEGTHPHAHMHTHSRTHFLSLHS